MIISLADGRLRFYPHDDSPNTPLPISRRLGTSTGCFPSNSLEGMGLMILYPQIWSNLERSTWVTWGLAMVGVMLSGWPGKKGAYSAVRWVESWVLSHGHFTDHPSLVIWYLVSDHVSLVVAVSLSPNDMFEMAVLQNSAETFWNWTSGFSTQISFLCLEGIKPRDTDGILWVWISDTYD